MIGETAVFVCYVPGLDLRRVDERDAPYISALLAESPGLDIRTIPDTELLPTLLTGVYPHEHGIWQVRLKGWPAERARDTGALGSWLGSLTDFLSTTVQGAHHAVTRSMDLATLPARRRRLFELHRFKYERRENQWIEPSARTPSIFSMLGRGRSRYVFSRRFSRLEATLEGLVSKPWMLEFFELYAYDLTQHWNLDRPGVMRAALQRVDGAVRQLHARCRERGRTFVLLSDHGQEAVRETIDLRRLLEGVDASRSDYVHFVQPPSARFWFRSERARRAILEALAGVPGLTLLGFRELRRYGIQFETPDYGEVYAFADPGHVFFPHDFYQPLANLFLGLLDSQQRPRVLDPVHRGSHGHLPEAPSERGFLTVAGGAVRPEREEMELVDFLPTLLSLLHLPTPERLPGACAFTPR